MAGFFVNAQKRISRISAAVLGAELYYNRFIDAPGQPEDNSKPAILSSLNIGHEFLFKRIIFSQQYGRYITDYPRFFKYAFYHRWGLRYKITDKWLAGFNLKVHRFTADFIDFRLMYKIR